MKQKVLCFLLATLLVLSIPLTSIFASDDEELDLMSSGVLLIDTDRGQLIYSKQSDQEIRSSLCAVIMAAILVIENSDKPSVITVSSIISSAAGNTADILPGQRHSIQSLLNILILRSASDIAMVLADSVAANVEAFISRMNEKAVSLGMQKTLFSITGGTNNRYFTASTTIDDMSKLLLYSLRNQTFRNIFTSRFYIWQKEDNSSEIIANSNDMLWQFDHVTGGMKSQNTLLPAASMVTTASRNNLSLLCIIAENTRTLHENDIGILLGYAYDNYRRGILASANKPLTSLSVSGITLELSPNSDIHYTYPIGHSFIESVDFNLPDQVSLPVYRNVSIGSATYRLADGTVINVMLYPDRDILPSKTTLDRFLEKLKEQKDLTAIVILLLIIEMIWLAARIIKRHLHK